MLIAGADTVLAIHLLKWLRAVNRRRSPDKSRLKFRRRQLEELSFVYHPIDATAAFFADFHPPHEIGQPFITRLVAIDEPINHHDRLARV